VGDPFLNELLAEAGVTADPNYHGPRCPGCNAPIRPDAVLCVKCGFDVRTGQRIRAQIGPSDQFAHLSHSANAEELISKAEQEIKERPIEAESDSGGDMLMSILLAGGLVFALVIAVGVGYLVFRFADAHASSMTSVARMMLIVGIPILVIGRIWLLVLAFTEGVVQGLLVLFCPCYDLIYGFSRFNSASIPVVLYFVGNGMLITALAMFSIGDSQEQGLAPPPAIQRTATAEDLAFMPSFSGRTAGTAAYVSSEIGPACTLAE
jgi:hypothetical protein